MDAAGDFLKAALEERARLALDPDSAPAVRALLGERAFQDYSLIARRVEKAAAREHLADSAQDLLFVPGVMGSLLVSVDLGGVWWVDVRTRKHIDDLRLNSEGTESADPRCRVAAFTTDPTYEPFRAAVLERDDFRHEVFPYDWRMSLSRSVTALRDQIVRMFESNGRSKVHLVAHSMGGLLVRSALASFGADLWPKVGRIVFIATPHYGSPAIAGYLKNHLWGWDAMSLLGVYLSRPTFRSLWGVLELLPAPRGIYPGTRPADPHKWEPDDPGDPYVHPCSNFDLYSAADWQLDLQPEELAQLQRVLDGAAAFHGSLFAAHQGLDQELRDRMAVIAGVGFKSLFRLAFRKGWGSVWKEMEKVTDRIAGNPHRDGDGRVPLASGELEFAGQVRYVRGEHGNLPAIPAVYSDVFRWLTGKPMQLASSPAGAFGDHLGAADYSPDAPDLVGKSPVTTDEGDPGYWRDAALTQEEIDDLDSRLAAGEVPDFNRLHLL